MFPGNGRHIHYDGLVDQGADHIIHFLADGVDADQRPAFIRQFQASRDQDE